MYPVHQHHNELPVNPRTPHNPHSPTKPVTELTLALLINPRRESLCTARSNLLLPCVTGLLSSTPSLFRVTRPRTFPIKLGVHEELLPQYLESYKMHPTNLRNNSPYASGHLLSMAASSYTQKPYPSERFCQNDTLFRPARVSAREACNGPQRLDSLRGQPPFPRRDSLDMSLSPISRRDHLRQMEPQESPSAVSPPVSKTIPDRNLEDFAFSPLTEANGMVAFSVAECALMGDEFDEDSDIDRTIKMIEQRATNSSNSATLRRFESAFQPSCSSKALPRPVKSHLSAAAPVFDFKPKIKLPWEEAEAQKVGMDVLAYQTKQMLTGQGVVFRTQTSYDNDSVTTSAAVSRPVCHARSRSDCTSPALNRANAFFLNTPTQVTGPFGNQTTVTKEAMTEEEAIAQLPPPRSMTPLPFKRPSFAQAMLMSPAQISNNNDRGKLSYKGNGLPTLAEISARYKAARLKRDTPQLPSLVRSKRDSTDSLDSLYSGTTGMSASSSEASVPSTPSKSRLPAFLQHRRSNSSHSSDSAPEDDIVIYSPTKETSHLGQLPSCPQTPQSSYPIVRVTPPSVDSALGPGLGRSKAVFETGRMQVMVEDADDMTNDVNIGGPVKKMALDILCSLPTITCTPATAPGVSISPFAALEAQVQRNTQVEKRQERSRFMLSTLQRRSRAPVISAR